MNIHYQLLHIHAFDDSLGLKYVAVLRKNECFVIKNDSVDCITLGT